MFRSSKIFILASTFVLLTCVANAQISSIRNDPDKVGVVIFIHGITGNDETWSNMQALGPSWPDIVKNDALFGDMNVFSYRYPSTFFGPTTSATSDELAKKLGSDLKDAGIGRYERIVFIAHSLGSIITTKFLLDDNAFAQKTKAVFFYSPPFAGSRLAAFLSLLPASSNLISDLGALQTDASRDSFLTNLRNKWRNKKLALQIPVYCAYETVATPLSKSMSFSPASRVVLADSAERLCTAAFAPVEKDHRKIVRPDGRARFQSHELLKTWYTEVFPYAAATQTKEENSDVVMADCAVDRYGNDFKTSMSEDVMLVTGKPLRFTRRLPENWNLAYYPLLWRTYQPKVLLVHFSCFQQGAETNNEVANQERADDFARLLQTVRDSNVKVLVFSRAFREPGGLAYLFEYPVASWLRDQGRLVSFPTSVASAFSNDPDQRKRFRELVQTTLSNSPVPPQPVCAC